VQAAGREVRIEVDGGIKPELVAAVARAGADTFVAGSAIFGSPDYAATIRELRAGIAAAGALAAAPDRKAAT
jgi:ribulose-phosphate 3-epimerase